MATVQELNKYSIRYIIELELDSGVYSFSTDDLEFVEQLGDRGWGEGGYGRGGWGGSSGV